MKESIIYLLEWQKSRTVTIPNSGEDMSSRNFHSLQVGMINFDYKICLLSKMYVFSKPKLSQFKCRLN